MATVRFEQAVYGSFPFWDRGYEVLSCSPGCRPEWIQGLKGACQRLGERPSGEVRGGGWFALRLPRGPWMVVGVEDLGVDDRGRRGALAFHALFVTPRDYARGAGGSPVSLVRALRGGWSAEIRELPAGRIEVEPDPPGPDVDERAARIAAAIVRGRKVYLKADEPVDGLAREVWRALPMRVRRRASVATWAFGAANRFDLVAVPRLQKIVFDASYVDASTLDSSPRRGIRWRRDALVAAGLAVVAAAGLGLVSRTGSRPAVPSPIPRESPKVLEVPPLSEEDDRALPGDQVRVAEGLVDLADRCGVDVAGLENDPTALMKRLAEGVRYRGPLLSVADRSRLEAGPTADRERVLAWDAQVRRFLTDRPLPSDFAGRSLRRRLGLLAWSFHLPEPSVPTAEIPVSLVEALAVDGSTRPGSLVVRYPVLTEYAQFLDRLPRR